MKKIIFLFLFVFLMPFVSAGSFDKSLLDFNYLIYTFLENNDLESFDGNNTEIIVNKASPKSGEEVRIVIKDKEAKEKANIVLLNDFYQKRFEINELSPGTSLFFANIPVTNLGEENSFPFSTSRIFLLYKTYLYRFGGEPEKKIVEEKKVVEEKKDEEKSEELPEQEKKSCDYYKSEEVEGETDYKFIDSSQDDCERLEEVYKDELYNSAKERAGRECEKEVCVRGNCDCIKDFIFYPYEKDGFVCIEQPQRKSLSYIGGGACICKCS